MFSPHRKFTIITIIGILFIQSYYCNFNFEVNNADYRLNCTTKSDDTPGTLGGDLIVLWRKDSKECSIRIYNPNLSLTFEKTIDLDCSNDKSAIDYVNQRITGISLSNGHIVTYNADGSVFSSLNHKGIFINPYYDIWSGNLFVLRWNYTPEAPLQLVRINLLQEVEPDIITDISYYDPELCVILNTRTITANGFYIFIRECDGILSDLKFVTINIKGFSTAKYIDMSGDNLIPVASMYYNFLNDTIYITATEGDSRNVYRVDWESHDFDLTIAYSEKNSNPPVKKRRYEIVRPDTEYDFILDR